MVLLLFFHDDPFAVPRSILPHHPPSLPTLCVCVCVCPLILVWVYRSCLRCTTDSVYRTRFLYLRWPDRYLEGVRRSFKPAPLPASKRPETVVVKFPLSPCGCGILIRKPEENKSNENSASQLLFQVYVTFWWIFPHQLSINRILRWYALLTNRVHSWSALY